MIAQADWVWVIGFRWVHIVSACLLVGATFFFATALFSPAVASGEPAEDARALRARRSLQMLARVVIVLLIATGIYNIVLNHVAYERSLPLSHLLLGPHALLALVIAGMLEVGLSSRRAPAARRGWLWTTIVLMFITVAVASSLKYVREHPRSNAGSTQSSR
jgi:uncharacterized membrane protein